MLVVMINVTITITITYCNHLILIIILLIKDSKKTNALYQMSDSYRINLLYIQYTQMCPNFGFSLQFIHCSRTILISDVDLQPANLSFM